MSVLLENWENGHPKIVPSKVLEQWYGAVYRGVLCVLVFKYVCKTSERCASPHNIIDKQYFASTAFIMAEDEGPTAPRRRIHNIGSSKSVKMHQRSGVDDLTWSNIRDCSNHSKTEKFLWDANISTDLNQTDNFLLKVCIVVAVL